MKKGQIKLFCIISAICVLLFAAAVPASAAHYGSAARYNANVIQPSKSFYVTDNAGVIDAGTESYIVDRSAYLYSKCGAQICVVTLRSIGTYDIEDYAYELFNSWGIGSADRENGVLLLLVTEDELCWCLQGAGLETTLPASRISRILSDDMEADFYAHDFDSGVNKTFRSLYNAVCGIYSVDPNGIYDGSFWNEASGPNWSNDAFYQGEPGANTGAGVLGACSSCSACTLSCAACSGNAAALVILAAVFMIFAISAFAVSGRRRRGVRPGPFFFFHTHGPRPPHNHGPRGFGPPPPPHNGPRPPQNNGPRPPRGGGFGGFGGFGGGGSSRGNGSGFGGGSRSGGDFRGGGGGSRGGGAGFGKR